jgi:tetratricopeptide (TPR) repeat protein
VAEQVFERYKEALKQGHVATFRGKPKEALEYYREAAKLAGHRPLPFISIGSVLLQLGRPQEAIAAYDEALQRSPDDRQALNGKAAALLASGKRNEAATLLERVAQIETAETTARDVLDATARAAAWAGGPEPLVAAAEKAKRDGNIAGALDAYVGAAAGYAERNEIGAALDACQRGLLLSLGSPSVHLQMTRIYLQHGSPGRAAERMVLLDRLLALDDDPAAFAALRDLAREHAAADPRIATLPAAG